MHHLAGGGRCVAWKIAEVLCSEGAELIDRGLRDSKSNV